MDAQDFIADDEEERAVLREATLRDAAKKAIAVVDGYEMSLRLGSIDVERAARREAWKAIAELRSALELVDG